MNDTKPSVKVAGSANQISPTKSNEVHLIISPSTNGWNDFGYRLMVDIYLALSDTVLRLGTGRLIVADHKITSHYIIEQQITSPIDINSAFSKEPFLFAFTEPDSYKKLNSKLHKEATKELLLQIHDWGAIINFDKNSASLEKLKNSEGLIKGLLREDKIFNTGKNLQSIFHEDSFFQKLKE